jgi:hypothetical protein
MNSQPPNGTQFTADSLLDAAATYGVPLEVLEALSPDDFEVGAILTNATLQLYQLEQRRALEGRTPELVIGQVRARLEELHPIRVAFLVHQQAASLLNPPTDR